MRTATRAGLAGHLPALRSALEEQRRFRVEQLVEIRAVAAPGAPQPPPHEQVLRMLGGAAQQALTQIDAAVARMDAGHYGRCPRCGDAIPLERLEVLPMVELCMACQRRLER